MGEEGRDYETRKSMKVGNAHETADFGWSQMQLSLFFGFY